jgi:hypothetical protein
MNPQKTLVRATWYEEVGIDKKSNVGLGQLT